MNSLEAGVIKVTLEEAAKMFWALENWLSQSASLQIITPIEGDFEQLRGKAILLADELKEATASVTLKTLLVSRSLVRTTNTGEQEKAWNEFGRKVLIDIPRDLALALWPEKFGRRKKSGSKSKVAGKNVD